MADQPSGAAAFMSALLNAVNDVTGRRPRPTWTHVDKVQGKLSTANIDAVHAAIRLAAAKNWLRVDGDPPTSVALTVEGLKLVTPQPPD